MNLKILNTTHLGGGSHGLAVGLETDRGTYGLEVYAPTQSDMSAADGAGHPPLPPARIFAHIRSLTGIARKTLHADPAKYAKQSNTAFLSKARNYSATGLLIAATTSPEKFPYDTKLDKQYVIASAGLDCDIVALPSSRKETPDTILERMAVARTVNATIPERDRKHIVPTVRLDNPRAVAIIRRLREAEADIIVIEFHGTAHMEPRLVEIAAVVRNAKRPPYLIGTNVPRMAKPSDASGVLWAAAYGIQASALQVGHFNPGGKKSIADLKWLVRAQGGYTKASAATLGHDCGCPDGPTHAIAGDFGAHLNARRRHEGWALVRERDVLARAIIGDKFPAYLRTRPTLAMAFPHVI